jgi:hypothetical protein
MAMKISSSDIASTSAAPMLLALRIRSNETSS